MVELNKRNIVSRNFGGGVSELVIGQESNKSEGQVYLGGNKLGRYEDMLFSVNCFPSYPASILTSNITPPQPCLIVERAISHSALFSDSSQECGHFNLTGLSSKSRAAFTLAEVLITLGIIGIVAAMTMPVLIANHNKSVVETRLKKFYSSMNQAIKMAEAEYGDKEGWHPKDTDDFWNNYLSKHLNYVSVEEKSLESRKQKIVSFADGSAVKIDIYFSENDDGEVTSSTHGGHFIFCTEAKYCQEPYFTENKEKDKGKRIFTFGFWPNETNPGFKYHKNKGVEPYVVWWDGKEESLYNSSSYGCNEKSSSNRMYCAAVIQHNGWKIPKDYPFRF